MSSAAELVAKAASQVGVKERPAGSNRTKYGKWYGMDGQPWCDMFVSWCADQVGAGALVGKFAYCPYHVSFFKKQGVWLGRTDKPQAGDIVFFANRGTACHVGIVERRIGPTEVQTIEGNTSATSDDNGGAVMRRTRGYGTVGSSWYILGFARPEWPASKKKGYVKYTVTASALNFRAGPGTSFPVRRVKKRGAVMNIGRIVDGWGRTKTGDWGSMKYMRRK